MNDVFEPATRRFARLVDSGAGRRAIHWLIFLLFAATMALLHARGTFQGLKSPRAMEEAQLARALANGEGLATRCIRPLSLWKLAEASPDVPLRPDAHPDLLHPPVWPALLGISLRAAGRLAPRTATTFVDPGDYWPVAVAHLFAVLSVLWVWLIARRMFDARTGTLSAASCLLCALLWRRSGMADDFSCALFFLLGAVWFALCAVDPRRNGAPWPDAVPIPLYRCLLPLLASSACTSLAFLSRYSAGTVAFAVFLYLACARHRRGSLVRAILYLLLCVLWTLPWILRNLDACGSPFGLAPLMALSGTYLFPGDALPRSLHPAIPEPGTLFYALQLKTIAGLRALTEDAGGFAGAGPLLALALAQYLHRFRRFSGRILRWCLLPSLVLAWMATAVFGESASTVAAFFFPLLIPGAWAFFLVLLDRLRPATAASAALAVAVVLLPSAWPFVLDIVPPRTGLTYPPYYHAYITWTCNRLSPGETMTTDIPWATAWYGGTPSVLLPRNPGEFSEIDRAVTPISLAYLTTEIRNRPWISDLADPTAPDHGWYGLMSEGRVPGDFPLQHARFLGGSDQLLLASRPLE